ncbi:MAG: hypothetical protein ABUT39_08980 [Acidobacteriota bacterium]
MIRIARFVPLALLLVLPLTGPARGASAPQGTPEQVQTIHDIRNVGTAMFHWYKDQMAPRRSPEAHDSAEQAAESKSQTLADIPVISNEELAKLLVPKYIDAIPTADGWGRPYEFRLNTQDPNAPRVMALRSAGQDGEYSGDTYEVSDFPGQEQAQDIAWVDGFFVRWPTPPPSK